MVQRVYERKTEERKTTGRNGNGSSVGGSQFTGAIPMRFDGLSNTMYWFRIEYSAITARMCTQIAMVAITGFENTNESFVLLMPRSRINPKDTHLLQYPAACL